MTTAKTKSREDGKRFLQEAFLLEQKLLQTKLEFSSQSVTHPGKLGEVNECYFIEVLRKYLPKRYAVDTGIVIDSTGATSDQIDVIIYDNQYTPTLLDQQDHRFVPSEAVYGVFEVKPTINKGYLEYAGKKAESVRRLKRTSVPIIHAGGEFPAKQLFPIVAGIVASKIEWTNGFKAKAFLENYHSLTKFQILDCGLAVSGYVFDVYNKSLKIGPSEQALAYFLFRLLQKLQSLGTVPAIDWNAYATALGQQNKPYPI
ncbi:MAG: hypothetical protein A2Y79_11005 [Deltaproteobacteria bacterium RBG_13_43_22]|jgi:hypothetical protein|nr:MAG: hypothetical protein A2Y79_11005 [Deltaproteobacteria bacterium RBG_13_43_22]